MRTETNPQTRYQTSRMDNGDQTGGGLCDRFHFVRGPSKDVNQNLNDGVFQGAQKETRSECKAKVQTSNLDCRGKATCLEPKLENEGNLFVVQGTFVLLIAVCRGGGCRCVFRPSTHVVREQ